MRYGIAAVIAATLSTPALAEDLEFTLQNDSSHTIAEIYVSPNESDEWGDNLLVDETVAPGGSGTITIADGLETCNYDLRFVTDEGAEAEKTQDLCEIGTFTVTD